MSGKGVVKLPPSAPAARVVCDGQFACNATAPARGDLGETQFWSAVLTDSAPRLTLGPTYQVAVPLASLRFGTFGTVFTLSDMETKPIGTTPGPLTGYVAKGTSSDLSALGYAEGAPVSGLFLQDPTFSSDAADPVFIAGMPVIPEPAAPRLLLAGVYGVSFFAPRRIPRRASEAGLRPRTPT